VRLSVSAAEKRPQAAGEGEMVTAALDDVEGLARIGSGNICDVGRAAVDENAEDLLLEARS